MVDEPEDRRTWAGGRSANRAEVSSRTALPPSPSMASAKAPNSSDLVSKVPITSTFGRLDRDVAIGVAEVIGEDRRPDLRTNQAEI